MNERCEEFRALWSAWHAGQLDPDSAARCSAERDRCTACARYDRQMSSMLRGLSGLPFPDAPPEADRLRLPPAPHRSQWAIAAGFLVAFTAGVLVANLPYGTSEPETNVLRAEVVRIQPSQTQEIQVAVASPHHIPDVEFTIELPDGIELDGYPGQRVVRWNGELAAGRSRLTLPVRATPGAEANEIVARIRHDGGSRELRVPLDVVHAGAKASAPARGLS